MQHAQETNHTTVSGIRVLALRRGVLGLAGAVTLSLGASACSNTAPEPQEAPSTLRAEGLWQVEPLRLLVVTPSDMRVSSQNRVWISDTTHNVVFRINPPADEYLRFGFREEDPVELVQPQRLAVHPNLGVFVYDAGTRKVDLYAQESATHLRGFPVEFEPELMGIADQPFGLTFGVVDRVGEDRYRLTVIRTGVDGEGRDTLLGPDQGPPSLRGLTTPIGDVFVAPSRSGFWLWARSVPDTVFEIAPRDMGRRIVLNPEHREVAGLLNDREAGILWTMFPDTAGIAFHGYDHGQPGEAGAQYGGTRITPASVLPFDVNGGVMIAWARTPGGEYLTRAYDMKVDSLVSRIAPDSLGPDGQRPSTWTRPAGG